MGSIGLDLPPAASPNLILTKATPAELRRIWISTYGDWGRALSVPDYVERERFITTIPGSDEGRMTSWVLVEAGKSPEERSVLSSCDTWRKPALVASPDGSRVQEGVAHVIGGVFTAPEFRGRGYAGRMMTEVAKALETYQADQVGRSHGREKGQKHNKTPPQPDGGVVFSVLYSDIGKHFYARHGWRPYRSSHVAWTPAPHAAAEQQPAATVNANANANANSSTPRVRPLCGDELGELCAADERAIRARLPAVAAAAGRPAVAILPCLDNMRWHLDREAYMTSHVYADARVPAVRGAIWSHPDGRRVWAVWMRGYYGGVESNTLNILRVAVLGADGEDDAERQPPAPAQDMVDGFRAIVDLARAEAARWDMGQVQFWNPEGVVRDLVDRCGIDHRIVDREEQSIASLMWYGKGGKSREVEWVANEKFAWC